MSWREEFKGLGESSGESAQEQKKRLEQQKKQEEAQKAHDHKQFLQLDARVKRVYEEFGKSFRRSIAADWRGDRVRDYRIKWKDEDIVPIPNRHKGEARSAILSEPHAQWSIQGVDLWHGPVHGAWSTLRVDPHGVKIFTNMWLCVYLNKQLERAERAFPDEHSPREKVASLGEGYYYEGSSSFYYIPIGEFSEEKLAAKLSEIFKATI